MEVEKSVEAEIDALLAHDDSSSVIDALLAIPTPAATDSSGEAWQQLLHARLQSRVSRRMRETLEAKNKRQEKRP
jgi:hypothetical protein